MTEATEATEAEDEYRKKYNVLNIPLLYSHSIIIFDQIDQTILL